MWVGNSPHQTPEKTKEEVTSENSGGAMKTVVLIADTHTNHKVGLNIPTRQLDEGDTWGACKIQRWLFNTFGDFMEQTDKLKKGELIGVVTGDFIDIDEKDRTHQIISRDQADAVIGAQNVLEPFANMCESVYFIRGTEAHVGKSAWAEELVASDFDNAVVCPDTKKKSWWHLPLEVEKVQMDIAHHPASNGGGRPMNSLSPVSRLATDTLFQYANAKERLPNLVIRAHIHRYADSRDAFSVRGIILPPLCLLGAFARRLGINETPQVGGLLIFCENGEYEVKPILYQPKRSRWIKR
jgi:hypothetical protein